MKKCILLTIIIFCIISTTVSAKILINEGFENNAAGDFPLKWKVEARLLDGIYIQNFYVADGNNAVVIDGRNLNFTPFIRSSEVDIVVGKKYIAGAFVKQHGIGVYRVAVEWLDKNKRIIQIDNDWAGRNNPQSFLFSGGTYTAPIGASYVRFLLGVEKNNICYFDKVFLEEVEGELLPLYLEEYIYDITQSFNKDLGRFEIKNSTAYSFDNEGISALDGFISCKRAIKISELNSYALSLKGNGDISIYVKWYDVDSLLIKENKYDMRILKSEKISLLSPKESYFATIGLKLNGKTTIAQIKFINESDYINSDNSFCDIENHWAKGFISEVASREIMQGEGVNIFNPDGPATRAQAIKSLIVALGVDRNNVEIKQKLQDLNEKSWYTHFIKSAIKNNIIPPEMYWDKNILPDTFITREEIASLIVNCYNYKVKQQIYKGDISNLKDSEKISEWAVPYVGAAYQNSLMRGYPNGDFNPKSIITRAELATMIINIMDIVDKKRNNMAS